MTISPFFKRDGVTIYHGDCREVLASLPAACVHTVVTSPPYWGLRDYGVDGQLGLESVPDCLGWATRSLCGECYVCRLTQVEPPQQFVIFVRSAGKRPSVPATLADAGIRRTWRDVGPCRVRLASLADEAKFRCFDGRREVRQSAGVEEPVEGVPGWED